MSREERISGWLIIVYASFMLLVLSAAFLIFFANFGEVVVSAPASLFSIYGTALLFFILINLLGLIAGILVVRGEDSASRLALPFSIVSILNVPVGTLVGGFYLWQYLRKP
ncbi:hypothetical protein SAMN04487965_1601 [Microbulbifer donghaiensis]|uniref:Uncharacterized protein n=1 Tax=Microbulbifer donghaiensis TaxID=494016 RepID=A0A1M4ZP66_9GAMM|nr:hypothetical protein [Microbulbifer donghaiensis]SHF19592.1 hypothetical protein SAMN04487965_1601 [Microbulbifer donghaiensis]